MHFGRFGLARFFKFEPEKTIISIYDSVNDKISNYLMIELIVFNHFRHQILKNLYLEYKTNMSFSD